MTDKKGSVKFITEPFRLAFPEVFEAKKFNEASKPKYSINLIFEPGSSGIQAVRRALFQAAKEKWGDDRAQWPTSIKKIEFKSHFDLNGKNGFPIRDGDTVGWDGYAGMEFCKAASEKAPGLVDRNRVAILDSAEVYGGLICRAALVAYAFDRPDAKGVALALRHLQVLKDDGVKFGGGRAEDEFDDLGDGALDDEGF